MSANVCTKLPRYSAHLTSLKHPFRIQRLPNSNTPNFIFIPRNISTTSVNHTLNTRCAASSSSSSGINRFGSKRNKKFKSEDPFWISLAKDVIWGLKSSVIFLVEQPGQLKYIEWPSFQSTLKTASLTLVLVALLIVVLSSIDSALCYLLALLLRKTA